MAGGGGGGGEGGSYSCAYASFFKEKPGDASKRRLVQSLRQYQNKYNKRNLLSRVQVSVAIQSWYMYSELEC